MGSYKGTAVPDMSSNSPEFKGYTQPSNWGSPAVSGRDLIVHTDTLRKVAGQLGELAAQLKTALSGWQSAAGPAAAGVGSWTAAQSLAGVMNKAYTGVQQFTSQLQQAHDDMKSRLSISADRYDTNEQEIASLANRATDPTSTIVGAGGNNTPVDPTPTQARVLAIEHHQPGGMGENWQASFPITEDSSFDMGSTEGYTWEQVQSLLAATDPDAVTAAGNAYSNLYNSLTSVAGTLSGQGAQLAADWGGSTAVTAVSQVQQLWQTASDMQANTFSAAASLKWYGGVLATYQNDLPTPSGSSAADKTAADKAAQQRMQALNQHIQTAYYNMPGAVNKNLPPPLTTNGGNLPGTGGTTGGGGGAGGAMPAVTGGGAPSGSMSGAPGGPAPGGPAPVGTLSGVTGHGAPPGDQLSGIGPGGAVTPVGPAPTVPTGPVPGGPAPVSTLPGGPGPIGVLPPPTSGGTGPGGGDPGGSDPVGVDPVGVGPGGSGPSGDEPLPGEPGPIGIGPGGIGPGGIGPGGVGPGGDEPLPGEPGPIGIGVPGGGGEPGLGDPGGAPGPIGIGGVGGVGGTGGSGDLGGVGGSGPVGPAPEPGELAGLGDSPPGIGPDGMITGQSMPGGMAAASGDELAASSGAMGDASGQGMMPMMGMPGGGSGVSGLGRDRESWTTEDDGTWGPDGMSGAAADSADAAADGMFPGMMPMAAGGGQSQDRDRFRQAWMAEEDDVWGAGQPAVPPVISPN